ALARLTDLTPPVHVVVVGDIDDLYQEEADSCAERAKTLGVADRLHLVGQVSDDRLLDAYRSADIFAMTSVQEGFCLPLVEAMACGVPVVAARAGALSETVAAAGLTFVPDNADDLASAIRRVLQSIPMDRESKSDSKLRVAIVAFRYGTDFVGGAETSLRTA